MNDGRGSVTAFVVILTSSLMLLVGLVHDGGRLVAAHLRAADRAAAAARAGAQELEGLRTGYPTIDVAAATQRARDHLASDGTGGVVDATAHSVTVTVRDLVVFELLTLLGVKGGEVAATRTAVVVRR